jgi:hypothetical protein
MFPVEHVRIPVGVNVFLSEVRRFYLILFQHAMNFRVHARLEPDPVGGEFFRKDDRRFPEFVGGMQAIHREKKADDARSAFDELFDALHERPDSLSRGR